MFAADLLYYIKDYNGNYYKLNFNRDSLELARDKDDATEFTFREANGRTSGRKSQFFYMTPIEEDKQPIEDDFGFLEEKVKEKVVENKIVDKVENPNLENTDIKQYLNQFTEMSSQIGDIQSKLQNELSDTDKVTSDILHYIELYNVSDDEAIELISKMKECREERRNIKDGMYAIEMFKSRFATKEHIQEAKEVIKCIEGLEKRKYTPRKLPDLFSSGTMDKKEKAVTNNSKNNSKEDVLSKEIITMDMTKKQTIFDDNNNDWYSFAKQQRDFYENINQFIVNLKIDIARLEELIEKTLLESETGKYNVTQGYKIFKLIQDLRIEKRNKQNELKCVELITKGIDCDYMYDKFSNCKEEIEQILNIDTSNEGAEIICLQKGC